MSAVLRSRLPAIAAGLDSRVNVALKAGAEIVSTRAKEKAPDAPPLGEGLVEAIHVEDATNGYSVVTDWKAHFLEFGTTTASPQPFLIPAAEESLDDVAGLVTAALRGLQVVSNKAIRTAIYSALNVASVTSQLGSGSASLVHGVAPPTAVYPICLFNRQSDVSRLRMGGNAFDSQIWLIKGIVRATSPSVAEDIDKAVRDLLDFGSLTITGGSLMHLARESGVDYTEPDGDQTYRHAGSLFRLIVQT